MFVGTGMFEQSHFRFVIACTFVALHLEQVCAQRETADEDFIGLRQGCQLAGHFNGLVGKSDCATDGGGTFRGGALGNGQ
jgi:hypothetical protein